MTRSALITGAGSGIGLAIAHVLGEEGYDLTVAALDDDDLPRATAELRGRGFAVLDVAVDVADEAQICGLVATHEERYGRLDVLVSNAGVGIGGPVERTTTDRLDRQLAVNLRAPVLLLREAVHLLRAAAAEHREALVVSTASLAGVIGEPMLGVYAATKGGLIAWTESMHRELSGEGIRSTALCPGFVDTPMTDFVKDRIDPGTMMLPQDLAEAVRFLLRTSPMCSVPQLHLVGTGHARR
ncbi:MAG: SDR family NAD(P)-dependent oxidoreductase [Solirubrobacteraceae bacterium]